MKIWEPKPPGTLWATPALLRDSFTFFTFCVSKDCSVSFLVSNSSRKNGQLDPEYEGTRPELFSERHGKTDRRLQFLTVSDQTEYRPLVGCVMLLLLQISRTLPHFRKNYYHEYDGCVFLSLMR